MLNIAGLPAIALFLKYDMRSNASPEPGIIHATYLPAMRYCSGQARFIFGMNARPSMIQMPEPDRRNLAGLLIRTKSFRYSPEKPFRLASGQTSPYYFDLRLLNGDPEGISAVGRSFYGMIKQLPEVRSVGGLATGSISIATAVSLQSWIEHEKDPANPLIKSFFVRKEQKTYGTGKRIEGAAESPAVIIDDVVTSGASALSAVDAAHAAGLECKCLMSVIFRGTETQQESIKSVIPLEYIFHMDHLVEQLRDMAI